MRGSEPPREIAVFFTGGTIAMHPAPRGRGIVPSGEFGRLFAELEPPGEGVRLRAVHWADLPSPHMTPELMFRLALDLDAALAEPRVLGAVVTHGTDVLVESAYMADMVIASSKPVVFTGSMRFYSELGYDGIRNLINGIKACLKPLPPDAGVTLLMTDRLFAARDVAKIHSLNIDAFEAPGSGPVATIAGDRVILTRPASVASARKPCLPRPPALEPDVPLITCYTGMDPALINHLGEQGIAGLVIEGFGAGNVPPGIVAALEALLRRNIPVVLTTRCIEGGVWPVYAYPGGGVDLVERGIIMAGRLSGPKARLRLMLGLGLTRDMAQIRRLFEPENV